MAGTEIWTSSAEHCLNQWNHSNFSAFTILGLLEQSTVTYLMKKFPALMEFEDSLKCSQKSAILLFSNVVQTNLYPHIRSL
jgi:hypothetical protein